MGELHRLVISVSAFALGLAGSSPAAPPVFHPAEGFEDDVNLVVAPNREFLVVPEEREDGLAAQLSIYDLDAATRNVLGLAESRAVIGWENGVDPFVTLNGASQVVIAPTESESGLAAEVLVLEVNDAGAIVKEVLIDLGDLGFEDDVDGVAIPYPEPEHGVIIPLEREDGSAAGLLAIDINPLLARFGTCRVVVNSLPLPDTTCVEEYEPTGRLLGFLDGVDGVAYTRGDSARLAIPVQSANGDVSDLVFFDFDFGSPPGPPPFYLGSQSVKDTNSPLPRKTPFPGFERDVDIALLSDLPPGLPNCLDPALYDFPLLVPVEDAGTDAGDLYLINGETGAALWRYDFDAFPTSPRILGYEEGVDVVPWCDAEGDASFDLVLVPTETEKGTDADLLIVNLASGGFNGSVELSNPGTVVLGYEKGVEPVVWTDFFAVVLEDDERGMAAIRRIDTTAHVFDIVSGSFFGFERGVDPFVMPRPHPDRRLYLPIETQDQTDADLIIFPLPPTFAGSFSFEAANPGVTVSGYERDVDLKRVNRLDGYQYLYVPEESEGGGMARLSVYEIPPQETILVILPAEGIAPADPRLFLVRPGGSLAEQHIVLGYETGLDPSSAVGDAVTVNPPATSPPLSGFDADTDNTLTMQNSYAGNVDGDALDDSLDCSYREGGVWEPPVEVTNLLLDHAPVVTAADLSWDSQDDLVGEDTCYDVASGVIAELREDLGYLRDGCLVNDLGDTPYRDFRIPGAANIFYYHVRAQNLCGTATFGPPELDTLMPCP